MAQTTYTSTQAVSLSTRAAAYDRLAQFLQHCDGWNINVLSIVLNADNTVSITVSKAVPAQYGADLQLFGLA
jgi:hypothetical protein